MQNRPKARAKAERINPREVSTKQWVIGSLIGVATLWGASEVFADGHENVTVSHGYTNFGELKYEPDSVLDYVNPDAPKGGEFSQWAQGTFDSFNLSTRKGVPAALSTIGYESILTGTADDPYGAYCYLCTTLEYPDSRDWVIFNLRDDVMFWDGTFMDAEDIKFTFELYLEQGITEYRSVYSQFIDSVEVLDTHRIRFNFTDEAPRRDVVTWVGGTSAFSKDWFEETGTRLDEASTEPFMATGPYRLDEVDIGRQIIYRLDPNWWGADLPINQGRNNFETIRVEYFADSAAAFEGFKSGVYTFRSENSSLQWATGYDFPAVQNGWVNVEELPDGSIGTGQGFVFNLNQEKFQDPRVREAITYMVNFEWMNESLFYGLYERPESFWDNSDLKANGAPSDEEVALLQPLVDEGLLDAAILTDDAVVAPVSETTDRPLDRRSLRAASALLDEAGWIAGDDGLRRKDGEVLTVTFLERSPQFDRIINPIVENLTRLGVDAKLDRVDTAQWIERRRSGEFDIVNGSLGQGYEPGQQLAQFFGSEAADDSSRNPMRLKNPAVDRLIEIIVDAENLEELTVATRALDRVLRAERFWIPQWQKGVHTVAYYDMFEFEEVPPLALSPIDNWWYNADRAAELREAGAFQ
ncbi:extracellular solute-binding protein [Yoonia litorea]|uniref:Microcin C transport system substrate-binding protein n=1 Tax=Yoonia litorea TaxID=1123755 RepID=A0A1I6LBU6_9RHOB|nr:extracellular solute-binding protein [Yoonia litorea]SFS00975.1 microcin C transport system substrate-binding protein [Yoonia litorea]